MPVPTPCSTSSVVTRGSDCSRHRCVGHAVISGGGLAHTGHTPWTYGSAHNRSSGRLPYDRGDSAPHAHAAATRARRRPEGRPPAQSCPRLPRCRPAPPSSRAVPLTAHSGFATPPRLQFSFTPDAGLSSTPDPLPVLRPGRRSKPGSGHLFGLGTTARLMRAALLGLVNSRICRGA